jgi:hypothetical protein
MAFKTKAYEKADYMYQKALLHFDYTFPEPGEQQARFDSLSTTCHQNLGIVKYHLRQLPKSQHHFTQALCTAPSSLKCWYWRVKLAI